MSSSVDLRFEDVPLKANDLFARLGPALRGSGLSVADFCHQLEFYDTEEDGPGRLDIDIVPQRVDVTSIEEAGRIGQTWLGRVHYLRWPVEGRDVRIAAYAWHTDAGRLVLAMDRSEWRWVAAEKDRVIRCGGLMCLVASAIGSPFGFMSVESEYTPVRVSDYEETLSRLGSGEACWPMLWVAQERLSQEAALDRLGRHYSVHYLTSGYSLALNEERLVQCAR